MKEILLSDACIKYVNLGPARSSLGGCSITCYSTSNVNHDKSELRPNTMEFMSSLQNGLDELKPSLFGNKYPSMTDLL